MIELNDRTKQDFLDREWIQKLLDAGVDIPDAKYYIVHSRSEGVDYIEPIDSPHFKSRIWTNKLPTYTISELLYKLRNRYGMYTIFNCYRNLDVNNISIIESLASILLQQHNEKV